MDGTTGLSSRHAPIYPPIQKRGPNEAELAASAELREHMDRVAPLDSPEGKAKRQRILNSLSAMTRDWIKRTCLAKGMPEEAAEDAGGTVLISGSYRIGVHDPDGDIDAVIVVPRSVNHDDCFSGLAEELRALPEVTELNAIREARVPIIGLKWEGIDLDLLFVLLTRGTVPPELDILDDELLVGLDEGSVASLNGPRVTDLIIKQVPDLEAFKLTVRAVRHWAKQRAVYSNKIGFLGGVNYNIMVAFVCQLYPNFAPAALLLRFFKLFAQWKWPQPVMLCSNYETALGLPVWNPDKNPREKRHRMPIITPAYPASNSSFNVSMSTLRIMREEFQRAGEVIERIMEKPAEERVWDELFEPSDFFTRYDGYLQVDATAKDAESLEAWAGWVEARLRLLVETMEYQRLPFNHICPYPRGFQSVDEDGTHRKRFFVGLRVNFKRAGDRNKIDLFNALDYFKRMRVLVWDRREEHMDMEGKGLRWADLPDVVFESLGGREAARAKWLPGHKERMREIKLWKKKQELEALRARIIRENRQKSIGERVLDAEKEASAEIKAQLEALDAELAGTQGGANVDTEDPETPTEPPEDGDEGVSGAAAAAAMAGGGGGQPGAADSLTFMDDGDEEGDGGGDAAGGGGGGGGAATAVKRPLADAEDAGAADADGSSERPAKRMAAEPPPPPPQPAPVRLTAVKKSKVKGKGKGKKGGKRGGKKGGTLNITLG